MRKLLKYDLKAGKNAMPVGATLLSVGTDNDGKPAAWAIVDTDRTPVDTLAVFVNGAKMPTEPGRYLGTFKSKETDYHVFQLSSSAQAPAKN